ncbi:hypothetical protein JAG44_001164 [Citrobacter koseri]|nr:hypothetical protein [Citrobacter koseri]HEM6832044.1 hypothetical protein [Citrobacter koseri]HEM8556206.1 hypothetical protein [Citrobacter koseri]
MKNPKSVNELLYEVNTFLRDTNPELLLSGDIHAALCNFADAVSQQQEMIDSLLEQLKANSPVSNAEKAESGTIFRRTYYRNGVPAGSIYFGVEAFGGVKGLAEGLKADVEDCLNDFISRHHFEYRSCFGPITMSCTHNLTPEQKAEWEQLQKGK